CSDSSSRAMEKRARGVTSRREKKFCSKATFLPIRVAQTRKICTTSLQFFPELACVGSSLTKSDDAFLERSLLFFVQGKTGSEQLSDLDVTETDLAETFLGGRTVAKKKKAAAKKAPKKKAKKKKKK